MLHESPILTSFGIITEKLSSGHNCIPLAGHLDISIDSPIQWKGLANAPNLTLLVVGYFFLQYQPLWLIRQQIRIFMNFSGWYVFLPRANLLLTEEWLWYTLWVVSDLIPLFRLKLVEGLRPTRSFGKSSHRKQVCFRECPFLAPLHSTS